MHCAGFFDFIRDFVYKSSFLSEDDEEKTHHVPIKTTAV